jgi:glycosyltransferase involved in cell wall biosynthesis
LQRATVLALPSLEDNCPMAVLEAMAAGVPVVAARVGGLPDLLAEGETGFFCDPLQAASMRDAIEKALLNPAETRRLALHAKQRARERFHPRAVAQRHVEIYREVLQQAT